MKPRLAALLLALVPSVGSAQPFVAYAGDPWPTVRALMESQECWAGEDQLLTLFREVYGYEVHRVVELFNDLAANPDFEYGASVAAWSLMTGPRCG